MPLRKPGNSILATRSVCLTSVMAVFPGFEQLLSYPIHNQTWLRYPESLPYTSVDTYVTVSEKRGHSRESTFKLYAIISTEVNLVDLQVNVPKNTMMPLLAPCARARALRAVCWLPHAFKDVKVVSRLSMVLVQVPSVL